MCLIIAADQDKLLAITKDQMKDITKKNDDGYGFMWARSGRVRTERGLGDYRTAMAMYNRLKHIPGLVFHARMATHGKVTLENAHPFKVNHKIALVHNGVMSKVDVKFSDFSDTWHFANVVMPDVIERSGGRDDFIFESKEWRKELEDWIGWSNKVVFMHADGRRVIMNEKAGTVRDGQWYSNTYAADFLSPVTKWSNYSYSSYGGRGKMWDNDYGSRYGHREFNKATGRYEKQEEQKPLFSDNVKPEDAERKGSKIANNPTCDVGVCHLCMSTAWRKCKGCSQFVCKNCTHDGVCFGCMCATDAEVTEPAVLPVAEVAQIGKAWNDEDGNVIELNEQKDMQMGKVLYMGGRDDDTKTG